MASKKKMPIGKRFEKGKSGNPRGRPMMDINVRDIARGYTQEAIDTLISIMGDAGQQGSSRVRAAEVVLDRAWGKALATMEVTGAEGGPIQLEEAKSELSSIIASIAARQGTGDVAGEPH